MSEVVIAALIGAGASIIVNLIALARQHRIQKIADAVKETRLEDRLQSIEGKLDTHNGYAEKITEIQRDVAVIKADIKNLEKHTA